METSEIRMGFNLGEIAQEVLAHRRIPRATYRLQFCQGFTFRQAQDLVAYFEDLGISDLYASPIFKPCSPEGHGYDICDHQELNPAIGTEEEFDALCQDLQNRGIGLILDVVPNHMGITQNNLWWMDVLENGPSSAFSCYFDIDFHPVKPELQNKVLLPILEDQYGKVLESGKFRLILEEGAFFVCYYEHKLPVAPRTYSKILGYRMEALAEALGKENEQLQELQSILTAIGYLPPQTEVVPEKLEERRREKEVIKRRLAVLYQNSSELRRAIDGAVEAFNGTAGDPRSFDLMDDLISSQAYRLAFWRVAADEINYRRFFDINHLAAIRMELPVVFEEAHRFIFRLLREGKITGLRVDHPDGLWNPTDYFHRLQESYLLHRVRALLATAPGGQEESAPSDSGETVAEWLVEQMERKDPSPWPLWVVAEKVLAEGESLPQNWAVYGTTGYDFLNAANGLFVESGNLKVLDRIYSHFIGAQVHFGNLVNSSKKMIMLVSLASEVQGLSHQLERLSEKNRRYRDFTLNTLTFVLREIIAGLPVYRTYITGPGDVPPRDRAYIEAAVEEAKRRNPRTAEAIFDFVRDTLLFRNLPDFPEENRPKLMRLVMQFQQITGPVMAKGLEDTAFYIYNRLVSLNEVGGNPAKFGISPTAFHRQNAERQEKWPHSLVTTSTHDSKRSEDVRARINVLSEIPGEWRAAVNRWSRWNASKKTWVDGQPAPDRNDEYLLYQTLVGAWPIGSLSLEELRNFRERIASYMRKATLEAKVHTSWINPNEEYDEAVKNFVFRLLDSTGKNRFLSDLQAFQRRVAYFGQFNSLAQVLLKLTCPGVPDIYQGTELWDLSLVDPDNRRPVDYPNRGAMLAQLKNRVDQSSGDLVPLARELLETSWDGRIKLYLLYRTLNFRRANPELFASGDYTPLESLGEKRDHVISFRRAHRDQAIIVVAPRLVVRLTGGMEKAPLGEEVWKDTRIQADLEDAGSAYQNLFTGERVEGKKDGDRSEIQVAEVFKNFPLALLRAFKQ